MVSPAVVIIAAHSAQRARGDAAGGGALMWWFSGVGAIPKSFGDATTWVYVARGIARIGGLIMLSVSLGLLWWTVDFNPPLASLTGGPWYSRSCDFISGCTDRMVGSDT